MRDSQSSCWQSCLRARRMRDARVDATRNRAARRGEVAGEKIETGVDATDSGMLDPGGVDWRLCVCPPCVPATCASLGTMSSAAPDGCGGTLDCSPPTPPVC